MSIGMHVISLKLLNRFFVTFDTGGSALKVFRWVNPWLTWSTSQTLSIYSEVAYNTKKLVHDI